MSQRKAIASTAKVRFLQASSISAFSREKLEKHFTDVVRKLRTKEKELNSVSAERDSLALQLSAAQDSALQEGTLQERLQVAPADENLPLRC